MPSTINPQFRQNNPDLADYALVGAGGGASFTHVQAVVASVWVVNHSLGFFPIVQVRIAGENAESARVEHPTVNQTVVTVTPAAIGEADFR